MANGGDSNSGDRAQVIPATLPGDNDPFANERMGAPLQRVVLGSTMGWPGCGELQNTINQLNVNGPNLIGRMDQFIGGTFKQTGVTFNQLLQMENSPQFSQADKAAIATLMNGFSKATGSKSGDAHMTGQQLAGFLKVAALKDAQQGCQLQKPPGRPGTI